MSEVDKVTVCLFTDDGGKLINANNSRRLKICLAPSLTNILHLFISCSFVSIFCEVRLVKEIMMLFFEQVLFDTLRNFTIILIISTIVGKT